jgi:hypothetical protein
LAGNLQGSAASDTLTVRSCFAGLRQLAGFWGQLTVVADIELWPLEAAKFIGDRERFLNDR